MDQTPCPKCNRLYCPGFWKQGVCIEDMNFCGEPTADLDEQARCLRVWYEIHRENWWDRRFLSKNQYLLRLGVADSFMISLIEEVYRIQQQCDKVNKDKNNAIQS